MTAPDIRSRNRLRRFRAHVYWPTMTVPIQELSGAVHKRLSSKFPFSTRRDTEPIFGPPSYWYSSYQLLFGYAFVDDTDLCITSQNLTMRKMDVALRMQQALTYGRRHSSYRRRNCPRGSVSLVPYRFQAAEEQDDEPLHNVQIVDGSRSERLSVSDARRKFLGVRSLGR
jgi:hypothetical protein